MRLGAYLSFLVRVGELIGQRESQAWRHILGQFYSCLQCHQTLLMLVLLGYIGLIITAQYRVILPLQSKTVSTQQAPQSKLSLDPAQHSRYEMSVAHLWQGRKQF